MKIFSAIYQMKSNIDNSKIIGLNYNDTFITLPNNRFIGRSVYYGLQLMIKNEDIWGSITFKPSVMSVHNFNRRVECMGISMDWTVFLNLPTYLNNCFKAENINDIFAIHKFTILGSAECQGLEGPILYPVSLSNNHRKAWEEWKVQIPKLLTDEWLEIIPVEYGQTTALFPKTTNEIFENKKTSTFDKAEQTWINGWEPHYVSDLIKNKDYDESLIKFVHSKLLNII